MIDLLLTLILTLTFGPATVPTFEYPTCAEDEIQLRTVCLHLEGDGWRQLP